MPKEIKLDNFVFYNEDKFERAQKAVEARGNLPTRENSQNATNKLYHQAVSELGNDASEQDILVYVYKGLGGRVEEFDTPAEAEVLKTELKEIRKRGRPKVKTV